MAGIKAPLQDILTRLATLDVTSRDGITAKLYARVWNNQVNSERRGELYDFPKPAGFVEIINQVQFQEIGGNFRAADLGINIHLVHEYYNADGTFEQDLEIFDLRDQVIALLSQYQPTGCGLMVCVNESQDTDHDNVYHYIIGFVTHFIDSKASPYDPTRNNYLEKEPPTDLQLDVEVADTPIYTPPAQQYKIPPQK